jgi:hypothetical protein
MAGRATARAWLPKENISQSETISSQFGQASWAKRRQAARRCGVKLIGEGICNKLRVKPIEYFIFRFTHKIGHAGKTTE